MRVAVGKVAALEGAPRLFPTKIGVSPGPGERCSRYPLSVRKGQANEVGNRRGTDDGDYRDR